MFHVKHSATFPQLLKSIEEHGAILPVYTHNGAVIDGSKRAICCAQLGLMIDHVHIADQSVAAQLLYGLHPRRALQTFAADLPTMQAARLLGASPKDIIELRREPKPRRKYRRVAFTKEIRARLPDRLTDRFTALLTKHSCTIQELVLALIAAADEPTLAQQLSIDRLSRRSQQ